MGFLADYEVSPSLDEEHRFLKSKKFVNSKQFIRSKKFVEPKRFVQEQKRNKNRRLNGVEHFSTRLVFLTKENRMARAHSTPNLQSIVEVETHDGIRLKKEWKDEKLNRVMSLPDLKKMEDDSTAESKRRLFESFDPYQIQVDELEKILCEQHEDEQTLFEDPLRKKKIEQPSSVISEVIEDLWCLGKEKQDDQSLHTADFSHTTNNFANLLSNNFGSSSSFFSNCLTNLVLENDKDMSNKLEPTDPPIVKDKTGENIIKKNPTKLNAEAGSFVPSFRTNSKSLVDVSRSSIRPPIPPTISRNGMLVNADTDVFISKRGDAPPGLSSPHIRNVNSPCMYVPQQGIQLFSQLQQNDQSQSSPTSSTSSPISPPSPTAASPTTFSTPFSQSLVQTPTQTQVQARTEVNMLPMNSVPINCFPEHTQRLIALGLFNIRPVAPKYTIAVIPTPQKKRRRRRKRRGKRRRKRKLQAKNEDVLSSSPCTEEDSELIRKLIGNLSCLNKDDHEESSDSEGETQPSLPNAIKSISPVS